MDKRLLKVAVMPALLFMSACMKDVIDGSWKGTSNPQGIGTSYALDLKTDLKDYAATYTETTVFKVPPNDANAKTKHGHVGCDTTLVWEGNFTDNPYDRGGILTLTGDTGTVTFSGCDSASDNATDMNASKLDPSKEYFVGGDGIYEYRVVGNTLKFRNVPVDVSETPTELTR